MQYIIELQLITIRKKEYLRFSLTKDRERSETVATTKQHILTIHQCLPFPRQRGKPPKKSPLFKLVREPNIWLETNKRMTSREFEQQEVEVMVLEVGNRLLLLLSAVCLPELPLLATYGNLHLHTNLALGCTQHGTNFNNKYIFFLASTNIRVILFEWHIKNQVI